MVRARDVLPVLHVWLQGDHSLHNEGSHRCFFAPHGSCSTVRVGPQLGSDLSEHSFVSGQHKPPCCGCCVIVRVRLRFAPSFSHSLSQAPHSSQSDIWQSTGHGSFGHSISSKLLAQFNGSTCLCRIFFPATSPGLLAQVLVHSPHFPHSATLQSLSVAFAIVDCLWMKLKPSGSTTIST